MRLAGCRQLGRRQGPVRGGGDPERGAARPCGDPRRPVAASGARGGQPPRGARDDGLQPRRPGPAPGDRPRGPARLRLRPPVPRRRADGLRLLRPAGPQGPLRRHGAGTAGLGRPRQRRGESGRPGAVGAGDDEAAGDLFRHRLRRALRLRAGRARWHPPRPPRQGVPPGAARAPRRAAVRGDAAVVRLLPRALRHPLPVRRVPPGLRPRVQRRRDGEPGLRHPARPVPLPRCRHEGRAAEPGQHREPRDVPHVVRRPRDDAVVGRPVAQRVLRRVHVAPVSRRRDRVLRRLGRLVDRAQGVGLRRGAVPVDAPGRRCGGARRPERPAELRRHLLREGRGGAAPAHLVRR